MPSITSIMQIAGFIIIGSIAIHFVWVVLNAIRVTAHQKEQRRLEIDLLEERIQKARLSRLVEEQKLLTWSGWRKFKVDRVVVEDENEQVRSFYLSSHDKRPIPSFKAGQFLTFNLRIPGRDKPLVRCYSLSAGPKDAQAFYRVSIKRALPPPKKQDVPAGLASNFFHDKVREGDILDVRAPAGAFTLDLSKPNPVALIAGGIGITPMISMLEAFLTAGKDQEIHLFYGVRNGKEHIHKEFLKQMETLYPNFSLHICYSDPAKNDRQGVDYHVGERISIDILKRQLKTSDCEFYLCGHPAMMASLSLGFIEWGVPPGRVHSEAFGPSAIKKEKTTATPSTGTGPAITFKKSGKEVPWNTEFENLWSFAQANNIDIDSGCLEGNCGACQTAIVSGEIEYKKTPSSDCEDGCCLTCCSVPKSALTLDA